MSHNHPKYYTLLCPGPVNVSRQVAEAYSQCSLNHRSKDFVELLDDVQRALLAIAGLGRNDDGVALVLTGSGTAANEAILSSTVPEGNTVVVLSNGEFGERLAHISHVYNRTIHLASGWAKPLDLDGLCRVLEENSNVLVAAVHHETSTGLINPTVQIGEICSTYGAEFFVDAVSSFSADPLDMDESRITYLSSSSGKALAAYPGLSFVVGRKDDFSRLRGLPVRNHYLNVYRYYESQVSCGQTPNTPATSLVASLKQALQTILDEGQEHRHERLSRLASYMRNGFSTRSLYTDPRMPQSVVLSNFVLPQGVGFDQLQSFLALNGFIIYGAKGCLQERYFQASTIGEIEEDDIDHFFSVFDRFPELRN